MSYDTRYEPEANFIMSGVLAHTQPYLKGASVFGASTSPTLPQVEHMIDRRVMLVAAKLAEYGYSTSQPVATVGVDVTTLLSTAVIYGTLMEIELGKAGSVLDRGQTGRWQMYEKRWIETIDMMKTATLEHMGATRSRVSSDGLAFTGKTWSEQDTIADDTDLKGSVFPRGFNDVTERSSVDFTEDVP